MVKKRKKIIRYLLFTLLILQCLAGLFFEAQCIAWLVPVQLGTRDDANLWHKSVRIPENHRPIQIRVMGGIWTNEHGLRWGSDLVHATVKRCFASPEGDGWSFGKTFGPITRGIWIDGWSALKGLAGSRFGRFPIADIQMAGEFRQAIDQDIRNGFDVIVVPVSYGAVIAGLALHDSPEHVGVLTLGSPVDLSVLNIPIRDVCVGADPVCAFRGPSMVSFGLSGPPTRGASRMNQHHPLHYLHSSFAQGSVMKAMASLCHEMGLDSGSLD